MDNPTTLLVAIMYVTIVATGLINVLMVLSEIVGGKRTTSSIHTGWLVLLLVVYLSFFWETTASPIIIWSRPPRSFLRPF